MNASVLRNLAIERYGVHGSRPVLKHLQDHLADFDLAMARHPVSRHFYFGTRQAVTRLTGVTFGTGVVQHHLSLVTPLGRGGEQWRSHSNDKCAVRRRSRPATPDRGLRSREKALFFTPKKLKKVISANKIKGLLHAVRTKKGVFVIPERAWTYRGHVCAFTRPVKQKPAEGLTGAPLGDGAPPLVGVRLSPYGGNHFPLGILGFERRRSPPTPPGNTPSRCTRARAWATPSA